MAKRNDLFETEISPGIKSHVEHITTKLENISTEWDNRIERILELRVEQQKKIQIIAEGYDEEVCRNIIL